MCVTGSRGCKAKGRKPPQGPKFLPLRGFLRAANTSALPGFSRVALSLKFHCLNESFSFLAIFESNKCRRTFGLLQCSFDRGISLFKWKFPFICWFPRAAKTVTLPGCRRSHIVGCGISLFKSKFLFIVDFPRAVNTVTLPGRRSLALSTLLLFSVLGFYCLRTK